MTAATPCALAMDAIVLAGGRGSRLGGVDKAGIELSGARLVERAVAAARAVSACRVAVVGPDTSAVPGAVSVREDPPLSGPLAALAAGLEALERCGDEKAPEWTLLLACDLVDPEAVCCTLTAGLTARGNPVRDGILLQDSEGRTQWLAGIYRVAALREGIRAVEGPLADRPLRLAFARAALDLILAPERVTADIDTPEDLDRARCPACPMIRDDPKEHP